MLPHGFEQPAAIALLLGGVLACFAGHRLFRIVLGIYGFVLGALIASSVMGVTSTTAMIVAAVVGGVAGSLLMVMAWFVGVSLVGAGIGVLAAHVLWSQLANGDPPAYAVIVVAVAGAIAAVFVQRYVIIVGTAFAGAWTIVLAASTALEARTLTPGESDTELWIAYPTSVPERWVPLVWLCLGLVGTAVQLATAGKKRRT
jgi:hypothetical protein